MKHLIICIASVLNPPHHTAIVKPALQLQPVDRSIVKLALEDDAKDTKVICVYPLPAK